MIRPAAAIMFALLAGCQAETSRLGAPESCSVVRVIDGDTVEVVCGTTSANVRLMGFDTPETFHSGCPAERALGDAATSYLEDSIRAAHDIKLDSEGTDKYQRILAHLYLDGRDVAIPMIENGMAVAYEGGRRIDWCERLAAR